MSCNDLTVTRVGLAQWRTVVEWERQEQWDIGLEDEVHFMAADPQGFYMGFVDGVAVSSLSVVNFSAAYCHVGHYLVDRRFRGQGVGLHTWKSAIAHDQAQACGLDSVVEQRRNYETWGFEVRHRVSRMAGVMPAAPASAAHDLEPIDVDNLAHALAFDAEVCGYGRQALLQRWFLGPGRVGWLHREGGIVQGLVAARLSSAGVRVGPLYAPTPRVVLQLLEAVGAHFPAGTRLTIDVPDYAVRSVRLLTDLGFAELFYTLRMYRGEPPTARESAITGLASLDLG